MISHLAAARPTAFGGACHFVSAATWKSAVPCIGLDAAEDAYGELAHAVASALAKPERERHSSTELGRLCCNLHEDSSCDCNSSFAITPYAPRTAWSHLRQLPLSSTGALAGLAEFWRLLPAASAVSASRPWPPGPWAGTTAATSCGPLRRSLHTSPPARGAAAVSAAAAAAAAAAVATTNTRRPPPVRRQQPLSPHAYEFQRRFFQLVNSGTAATMPATVPSLSISGGGGNGSDAAAAEAMAHTTNSQAIRMLLAWLEEGRMTAAAELQQQQQQAAATAMAPSPPGGAMVAAPYRLDQQVIDRAMEVLRRLYHREGLIPTMTTTASTSTQRGAISGGGGGSAAGGPMGLSELLNAAEVLAAAAPAMGLTFKRQHYELLVELYGKRALLEPPFRRGLAQRLLAVRQQMVQQLMPLSQMCLNTMLQGVRTDPLVNIPAKLAWAIRLVDRDLPVAPAAAAAVAAAGGAAGLSSPSSPSSRASSPSWSDAGGLVLPLQQTLAFLLRMAARQADWSAYGKLEAALVCRTRAPPPYEVLQEALHAASAAAGGSMSSRLAMGFMAQMEQLEAKRQQLGPGAKQQPPQQHQQQQPRGAAARQQQQQQLRWRQDLEADRLLDQELRSLRQLVHVGVAQQDEQLARKSYDRLRRLFWREHPAVAAAAAAAAKGVSGGGGTTGSGQDREEAAAAAAAKVDPIAANGHTIVLEAAEGCHAPPDATLELLSLALSRRDWSGVLDHVTALAELQSLVKRSEGRVGRLLLEDAAAMEGLTSAYGGLGALSKALISSEDDTVAYYTELLHRVGAAAAAGSAVAPFAGSSVPFGPPLRAAAARADLASVAAIVRQMRELHCGPGADSYAAVVEASLRGEKPEHVPGLIELMLEEGLVPTAPMWAVQLRAATEAGDLAGLMAVSERALSLVEEKRGARQGVADIGEEVLAAAEALAEGRADARASSAIKLLRLRGEELRKQRAERQRVVEERSAVAAAAAPQPSATAIAADSAETPRQFIRRAEAEALRRNAASMLQPLQPQWTQREPGSRQ